MTHNLTAKLSDYKLDMLAIIPGATMRHLTGLNFHLMERPTIAFFSKNKKPTLLAPEFECSQVKNPDEWQLFPWRDEDGVEGALAQCAAALKLDEQRIGVETLSMRVKEFQLLTFFAPQARIESADALITELRAIKTADEVENMQASVLMAEAVLRDTLPLIKIGMTEKELAAELHLQLLRAGSGPLPFDPLVQTGLTASSPHGAAGKRALAAGDLLVIDFGGRIGGYVSDITRTFAVGEILPKAQEIHQLVEKANAAGRALAAPGISCEAVDQATRKVIEDGGYGEFFSHRTGHGIGLDAHEAPFIVTGNAELLRPGMAFTIEPGIYVPDFGGVRIEDDMIVTETGVRSLSTFERSLMVVGA